jgi:predicted RNA-binding Zn ribbon-like protein
VALPSWVPLDETKPAPMPLLRVQAFVNTWESDRRTDVLADVDDAGRWLAAAGFVPAGAAITEDGLRRTRDVREGIRALLVHNEGGPRPSAKQLRPLRALANGGRFDLDVEADGALGLGPVAGDDLDAGLLGLLLVVRDAQADGSWRRLKACHNDECQWAFYDRSHSRRGTWCDMAVCGNRIKNRNLRERRR